MNAAVPVARADQDVVVDRLTEYGELSIVQARALRTVISKRMERSLSSRRATDGVRVAVEQAIAASKSSRGAASSVSKRLKAGLDGWALQHVFSPRPSSMQTCRQKFRVSAGSCEALLAASGSISLSRARALASGQQANAQTSPEPSAAAPLIARVQPAPLEEARATELVTTAPASRAALRIADVAPTPLEDERAAIRVPAPRVSRLPAPMSPGVAAAKAEYDRKRQAYWARRRQELEQRIVRIRAGNGQVERGPASELEREVVGLSAAEAKNPAGTQLKRPGASAQLAHEGADTPDSESGDLIEDLTSDPLGKRQ